MMQPSQSEKIPPATRCLQQLIDEAHSLGPVSAAVVDAAEFHILKFALEAQREALINPLLIGREHDIRALCKRLGAAVCPPVLAANTPAEEAQRGVEAVRTGQAQLLIKGHLHSSEFLHPIITELREAPRISHVMVCELSSYPKLLFITDAAINITPDLETKAQIIQNAVDLARLLGIDPPRVAALSAVELINPRIASTIDAACLAKMADRGQIHNAIVDGPLAFDNAISRESAAIKGIHSRVSGKVDILLVPDLESGNILYKDLEYLAGARFAGVVLGAQVPVVLTSRADPNEARLDSLALARVAWARKQSDSVEKPDSAAAQEEKA